MGMISDVVQRVSQNHQNSDVSVGEASKASKGLTTMLEQLKAKSDASPDQTSAPKNLASGSTGQIIY